MSELSLSMKLNDATYELALEVLGRIPKPGPGRKKNVRKFKLIDIRSPEKYNAEHFEAAINVPLHPWATFQERVEEICESNKVNVCLLGHKYDRCDAAELLTRFHYCGLKGEQVWTKEWDDLTSFKKTNRVDQIIARIIAKRAAEVAKKASEEKKHVIADQIDVDIDIERKSKKRPIEEEEDSGIDAIDVNFFPENLLLMKRKETEQPKTVAKRPPTLWQQFLTHMIPVVKEMGKDESLYTTCARIWGNMANEDKNEFRALLNNKE